MIPLSTDTALNVPSGASGRRAAKNSWAKLDKTVLIVSNNTHTQVALVGNLTTEAADGEAVALSAGRGSGNVVQSLQALRGDLLVARSRNACALGAAPLRRTRYIYDLKRGSVLLDRGNEAAARESIVHSTKV